MTTRRINVLDLTVDQVEEAERRSGVPLESWTNTPGVRLKVARAIWGVYSGATDAEVGAMTLRELTDAIVLDEDATPDPTPPRARRGSRT